MLVLRSAPPEAMQPAASGMQRVTRTPTTAYPQCPCAPRAATCTPVPTPVPTCARSLTPFWCSCRAQLSISARSSAWLARRAWRTSASAGEAESRIRPSPGCGRIGNGCKQQSQPQKWRRQPQQCT